MRIIHVQGSAVRFDVLTRLSAIAFLLASPIPVTAQTRGSISGHVTLAGLAVANPIIRMGMDPACAAANAGKRVIQESVKVGAGGSLANVFVWLQGNIPPSPVPKEPVVIDQTGCVYVPRVVGARVGQTLQFKNSDRTLHNVHSLSTKGNDFNVSEPNVGMVTGVPLKKPEVMLRIKCDVHSWMTTYVGVVSNPYFAVTRDAGRFDISNVPPGTYTLNAWHERYGSLIRTVQVRAGAKINLDLAFSSSERR